RSVLSPEPPLPRAVVPSERADMSPTPGKRRSTGSRSMLESSVVGAEAPIPPVTFPLPESRYFRRPEFRIVAAGTPLFVEGMQHGETARIVDGGVCLYQQVADGGRRILDVLGPGHLVGAFMTDL